MMYDMLAYFVTYMVRENGISKKGLTYTNNCDNPNYDQTTYILVLIPKTCLEFRYQYKILHVTKVLEKRVLTFYFN